VGEYVEGETTHCKEVLMLISLSLIVAMTTQRLIGNNGRLPWRKLPSDLDHFKKVTMETGTVIMGRATYESIVTRNGKPLSKRSHIVLTRKYAPCTNRSVTFVGSIEEACDEVADCGGHACVIGGREIYKLFLSVPYLVKAYITTVDAPNLVGDTYFPKLESGPNSEWKCTERSRMCKVQPDDEYATSLSVYERFGIV
jgi:dihydrofolate reductase